MVPMAPRSAEELAIGGLERISTLRISNLVKPNVELGAGKIAAGPETPGDQDLAVLKQRCLLPVATRGHAASDAGGLLLTMRSGPL